MGIKLDVDKLSKICNIYVDDSIMTREEFINEKYIYKNKKIPKKRRLNPNIMPINYKISFYNINIYIMHN